MLKYDKENNRLVETNELIKHSVEELEVLKKLFIKQGWIENEQYSKESTRIRKEKKEGYSK